MESEPHVIMVMLSNLNITFYPLSISAITSLLIFLVLLLCSALISGSEVAYFSLSPKDIKIFKNSSGLKAKRVLENLEKPNNLLATILVANNFINIGIVALSTYFINSWINFSEMPVLGFIIQVLVITFLLLLFGEIIPKIYANEFSAKMAKMMALPIWFMIRLFKPISYFLISSTHLVDKRFHKKHNISIGDISDALEITSESITHDKDILKGIVEFGNTQVSQIMCPRVDVMTIQNNKPLSVVIRSIIDAGYSRIPVYEKNFDEIKGILYIKDLLPHIHKNDTFRWQSLIRPPYFVPTKKKLNELLEELQTKHIHLAVVVDEYGGTAGIVTMEDILEEIVGDISDETDEDEIIFSKIDDNNYLFKGKTSLNDFYKITEINNDIFKDIKGDSDTLAGLILELKGNFPAIYDIINYQNLIFKIEELDNRRIKKIKITISDT